MARNASFRRAFLSGGRGDTFLADALQLFVNVINQRASFIEQAAAALPDNEAPRSGPASVLSSEGPSISAAEVRSATTSSCRPRKVTHTTRSSESVAAFSHNLGRSPSTAAPFAETPPPVTAGIWNGRSPGRSPTALSPGNTSKLGQGGGIFNRGSFSSSNTSVVDNTPDNIAP